MSGEEPKGTDRLKRAWLGGGVVLLSAAIAGVVWIRVGPVVSEAELRSAADEVEAIRVASGELDCRRPAVLGPATQDAVPLEDFLSTEGPFGACIEAAMEEGLGHALQDSQGVADAWGFVGADGTASVEASLLMELSEPQIGVQMPVRSPVPERFALVESACAGIEGELERQARTEDRCSPMRPTAPAWGSHVEGADNWPGRVVALAHAISIVARLKAKADAGGALRLLVQGIAVMRDVSAGATTLVTAMVSVAGELSLIATAQTILLSEQPNASVAREITDALELLSAPEDAYALLLGDSISVHDYISILLVGDPSPEALLTRLASAELVRRLDEVCAPGSTPETCMSSLPAPRGPVRDGFLAALLGPRADRGEHVEVLRNGNMTSFPRYLARLVQARGTLRLLTVLLGLVGLRGEGACADATEWVGAADPSLTLEDVGGGMYRLKERDPPELPEDTTRLESVPYPGSRVLFFACPARSLGTSPEPALGSGEQVPDAL